MHEVQTRVYSRESAQRRYVHTDDVDTEGARFEYHRGEAFQVRGIDE